MTSEDVKKILLLALDLNEVYVSTPDGSHFEVIAISEKFENLSRVKRQQMIYEPLMAYIADNRIHALSIKTYQPEQWQRERKLLGR